MDNFKFNFLSRRQLESLNLDKIFSNIFIQNITRGFFGNSIFAIFAQMLCGNHLNFVFDNIFYFLKPIYSSMGFNNIEGTGTTGHQIYGRPILVDQRVH